MASASSNAPPPQDSIDLTSDSDDNDLFGDRFVTQPTQPLTTPLYGRSSPSPVVQVRNSSPPPQQTPKPMHSLVQFPYPTTQKGPVKHGILANSFAPPGTQYQPIQTFTSQPPSQSQSQVPGRAGTIELSDDETQRRVSDSSEDELGRSSAADIKPSSLKMNGKPLTTPMDKGEEVRSMFQNYMYRGTTIPQKRSGDAMANAYGDVRPARPAKMMRQTVPAKAAPAEEVRLFDLDYDLQKPVRSIIDLTGCTVAECRDAYLKKHRNVNDASSYLIEQMERRERMAGAIDLTTDNMQSESQTVDQKPSVRSFKRPGSKSTVKRDTAPSQSIAQKWSTTQGKPSTADKPGREPSNLEPAKSIIISSSPPRPTTPTPKPVRRRLVQGRRNPSSPVQAPEPTPIAKRAPQPLPGRRAKVAESEDEAIEIDDDDDSSGAEESSDLDDGDIQERLLKFLNTCSQEDLIDVSSQSMEIVELVISKRPFKSLNAVRAVYVEYTTTTRTGKISTRKKEVGDKLVDVCLDMYRGYEAVDELVKKCEEMGKSITYELKQWGIGAFGTSDSQGELQIVDIPGSSSHDSGIGTPSSSTAGDEDTKARKLFSQPAIMSRDLVMKDYQVVGMNWLSLLFSKKLSCILADDMGLGKTCQVIAFLSHLYETGVKGPHLVVVPGSTLENWLREFRNFCPALTVEPYYGSQAERAEQRVKIEDNLNDINAIVTTYTLAQKPLDSHFLRHLNFVACVYDEGHVLKNSDSQRYNQLMRFPAQFRLLLTGTPLQNNLQELISLLAFIMPRLFKDRHEDLQYIFKHKAKTTDQTGHVNLLSAQRISRARSMMTPFILRRKKHQVLKYLPAKHCRTEYCDLSPSQQAIYDDEVGRVKAALLEREQAKIAATTKQDTKGKKSAISSAKASANVLMDLRKAAIHPLLFRRHYTEDILRKMAKAYCRDPELDPNVEFKLVHEDMTVMTDFELNRFSVNNPFCADYTLSALATSGTINTPNLNNRPECSAADGLSSALTPFLLSSGKVTMLLRLLHRYITAGDRTLIFSQFTMVLDVLELVLEDARIAFSRLDGTTPMTARQDLLDQFHADASIPVFMLSTKAGGAGINLACANRVVVFDAGFNPQEDVQAENRAHRVGQTREVEVVRLVTKGTIEEQIQKLGETKLALDERVAGEGGDGSTATTTTAATAAARLKGKGKQANDADSATEDEQAITAAAEKQGMDLVEGMLMQGFHDREPIIATVAGDDKPSKQDTNTNMNTNAVSAEDPQKKKEKEVEKEQDSSASSPLSSAPSTPTSTANEQISEQSTNTNTNADIKEEYLNGLKAAGLDMSAA